jgi:S-adenosylmethionine:tRNA ribosyltransferase-isomerase
MKVSDFHYALPDELIARHPAPERASSRLLDLAGPDRVPVHRSFGDLRTSLRPGDLLVMNDTRVLPARLFACKAGTGGGVEVLVERVRADGSVLAQLRSSKPARPGTELVLLDAEGKAYLSIRVKGRDQGFFELEFPADCSPVQVMDAIGHMPLPPYVDRPDDHADRERYQTVYAARAGAVAAPTAGLHFDQTLLDDLRSAGVELATLTLHVGAGTFQPLRCEDVESHRMHSEFAQVDPSTCEAVMRAHREGRRVIAVGTTTLRALESASTATAIHPFSGETDIFIYPGYAFRCVDVLITNFHLPESTLLMLVCAFAGTQYMLEAYRIAVQERYRFFSYGDAMMIAADRAPLIKRSMREGA